MNNIDLTVIWVFTVEADYTVVFFAAGAKHAPSWNWVWKTYRSLSRKYRKNLKQLVSHSRNKMQLVLKISSILCILRSSQRVRLFLRSREYVFIDYISSAFLVGRRYHKV